MRGVLPMGELEAFLNIHCSTRKWRQVLNFKEKLLSLKEKLLSV
jgi:hypothetical protein